MLSLYLKIHLYLLSPITMLYASFTSDSAAFIALSPDNPRTVFTLPSRRHWPATIARFMTDDSPGQLLQTTSFVPSFMFLKDVLHFFINQQPIKICCKHIS